MPDLTYCLNRFLTLYCRWVDIVKKLMRNYFAFTFLSNTTVQAARRVRSVRARCITVRSMVWIVTIREEEEVLVSEML